MLVLTSLYGIMKNERFRPTVREDISEWRGFKAGDRINENTAALSYVLAHHGDLFPSFAGLPDEARKILKFTQSGLEYNMGHLVQAEAPPGSLLRKFRKVVMCGGASRHDVAFYFAHWLISLAGADPTPLGGCEKFVLSFPMDVLTQFMTAFSIVEDIGMSMSETEVYEQYLVARWQDKPNLGPKPDGLDGIAKMRLVLMAQGDSERILEAFDSLPPSAAAMLTEELVRTGCDGQAFSCDVADVQGRGPAFLPMYGPAFLQKAGFLDPYGALIIFANILHSARNLYPLQRGAAGETVTLRLDDMKAETVTTFFSIPSEEDWVLSKTGPTSAKVYREAVLGRRSEGNDSRVVLSRTVPRAHRMSQHTAWGKSFMSYRRSSELFGR